MKTDLSSMTYDQLQDYLLQTGSPKFRANQLFSWIHEKKVVEIDEMSNLPADMRQSLKENAFITSLGVKNKQVSQIDGTIKYLFELSDKHCIETVQMSYKHGNSLCVSTQVGCKMGCKFCASTLGGLVRNLTAGEILSQVYTAEKESGQRISNIVLMGIGEPLDNFEEVIKFLQIISHPKGHNTSLRNISLSTCGLVPKITQLAQYDFPITLCISLHASDDESRSKVMPVNNRWNIAELLDACRFYFDKTGRRITFEYALIKGVTDSKAQAVKLGALLKDINCHVNLIPVNSIKGSMFEKSGTNAIKDFLDILTRTGISTTVRRELGSDISAACGQLRREDLNL